MEGSKIYMPSTQMVQTEQKIFVIKAYEHQLDESDNTIIKTQERIIAEGWHIVQISTATYANKYILTILAERIKNECK